MYDEKLYHKCLILLGIIVFIIIFYARGGQLGFSIFGTAFSSAGITLLLDILLFKTIIWKLYPKLFYKVGITKIPFLGGEWEGVIESDYVFPDTENKVEPISTKLEIRHKFDKINIRIETDKSHSSSDVAGIKTDGSDQKYLCYLYSNQADKNRDINPNHDGATRLRIKHDGELILEGNYWTGRNTTGSMKFRRKTRKNSPI